MAIFPQGVTQIATRCRHTEDGGVRLALPGAGRQWAPGSVKLTTLHASKGLEFHTVALIGLQAVPDPHAPHRGRGMALAVCAMTRATHRLVLAECGNSGAIGREGVVLGNRASGNLEAA